MKIWFIYKLTEMNDPTPFLYAYTTKKYLVDMFKEERNMDLFVVKKKDITKEQYAQFQKDHHNLELGRRGFYTSSSHSLSSKQVVYITATKSEEFDVFVNTDTIILELGKSISPYSNAFNRELSESLSNIFYFAIKEFTESTEYFLIGDESQYQYDTFTFNDTNFDFDFDELEVFIYLFGKTMKVSTKKGD